MMNMMTVKGMGERLRYILDKMPHVIAITMKPTTRGASCSWACTAVALCMVHKM